MALHWNVSACAEAATSNEGWPLTNALIYATMFIGINRITEKNVDEFYARLATYEEMFRPLTWKHDEGSDSPVNVPTTLDDIKQRIGLSTNATSKTRVQFCRSMGQMIDLEVSRKLRDMKEDKEAA